MRALLAVMVGAVVWPVAAEELKIRTVAPEWREASVGRPWMLRLETGGAQGAVEWMVAEGGLPPGLHLVDASMVMLGAQPGAVVYGAPAEVGSYWALWRARDEGGRTAETWMEIRVSALRLKEVSAMAKAEEEFEWRLEAAEGVAPFTVKASEAAFLPLGMTWGADGVLRGAPRIAGRYEIPVGVVDAGGNELKTTVELTVYGMETTLPPLGVRMRLEGCKYAVEWSEVAEGVEVRVFGGEGDTPLEVEVTRAETGERALGWYVAPAMMGCAAGG